MLKSIRTSAAWFAAGLFVLGAPTAARATPLILTVTAQNTLTLATETAQYSDVATALCPACTVMGTPNEIALLTPGSLLGGTLTYSGEQATQLNGLTNALLSSATTILNSGPNPILVTATVTGLSFPGPSDHISLTASGTFFSSDGSVMHVSYYDDPTNNGLTTNAQLVGTYTSPAAVSGTAFSYNPGSTTLAVPDVGPYSMSESWTYTLAAGGRLVSRGLTESKAIPEPSTLLVMGVGLLGLGMVVRRRKGQDLALDMI